MQDKNSSDYKKALEEKWKNLIFIHKGRVNGFDLFFLNFIISGFDSIAESDTGLEPLNWLLTAVSLFSVYIGMSAVVKRFRDIGISGWFAVPYILVISPLAIYLLGSDYQNNPYFIPNLIGLTIMGLGLIFWPSQKHDNKYGPYDRAGLFRSPLNKPT